MSGFEWNFSNYTATELVNFIATEANQYKQFKSLGKAFEADKRNSEEKLIAAINELNKRDQLYLT